MPFDEAMAALMIIQAMNPALNVSLQDLRYFVAIVEAGGLTQAAHRCHAAQPTLSHALARLEEAVGEPVLSRRAGKGVAVTEAGEVVLLRARAALASLAGLTEDLAALKGLARGTLRVATNPSLLATRLAPVLVSFRQKHAGVRLLVRALRAERLADAVRKGRADLGVLAGAPREVLRGLKVTRLGDEAFVLVVRRDDPLARSREVACHRLADEPLVLPPPATFTGRLLRRALARASTPPSIGLTLSTAEALRETVRAGLGRTILPEGYVREGDPDLAAIPLIDPTPRRPVVAVRRHDPHWPTPRSADAFLALL